MTASRPTEPGDIGCTSLALLCGLKHALIHTHYGNYITAHRSSCQSEIFKNDFSLYPPPTEELKMELLEKKQLASLYKLLSQWVGEGSIMARHQTRD